LRTRRRRGPALPDRLRGRADRLAESLRVPVRRQDAHDHGGRCMNPTGGTRPEGAVSDFAAGGDMAFNPLPVAVGRLSEGERVLNALRADIIHARIRPGASISEQEVATRFGVSRTPVRE